MSRPKGGVWILYVPGVGLEPTRPFGPVLLRHLRLPFRHPGVGDCRRLGPLVPGSVLDELADAVRLVDIVLFGTAGQPIDGLRRVWAHRQGQGDALALLEERTAPRRLGDHRPPGMAVHDRDHVAELEPRIEDGVRGEIGRAHV